MEKLSISHNPDFKNLKSNNIILGSKSPRRIELLQLMGIDFTIQKLDIKEDYPKSMSPIKTALFLSKKKSQAYTISNNDILICADTIVCSENKILGKPKSKKEAILMLKKLSNKQHKVVTAITIKTTQKEISFHETTIVHFKKLSMKEIVFYVNNFKPLDKAGGYGIQEWIGLIGIKKISGSFYNVMGLPTRKLYKNLKQIL